MHRQIMNAPPGMDVDHQDHNTLNNQRANLRVCTRTQNNANSRKRNGCTSRFKGVYWYRERKRWLVQITTAGRTNTLGYFEDEVEAACAYNAAALEQFKEFALLNTIP